MVIWQVGASCSGYVVELIVLAVILAAAERKISLRMALALMAFSLFRLMGEMLKAGVAWPRPCWDAARPALIECPRSFSFPSGHALGAAMVAVIGWLVTRKRVVGLIGLVWGVGVAVSRVMVGVHSWFDVIIGGLLGVVFGWVVWRGYWEKGTRN